MKQVECVVEDGRAAVLMRPLRREILRRARRPVSAAAIAERIGQPRQKVNYHVRELEKAGFLKRAGRRLKRNLVEQRYQATSRAYLLAPQVLGSVGARPEEAEDRFSAGYLLALTAQAQRDLAEVLPAAEKAGKRVATLSLSAQLRFEGPGQRREFTRALQEAAAEVIGRYSSPAQDERGRPGPGRLYRFFLGCYPVSEPQSQAKEANKEKAS